MILNVAEAGVGISTGSTPIIIRTGARASKSMFDVYTRVDPFTRAFTTVLQDRLIKASARRMLMSQKRPSSDDGYISVSSASKAPSSSASNTAPATASNAPRQQQSSSSSSAVNTGPPLALPDRPPEQASSSSAAREAPASSTYGPSRTRIRGKQDPVVIHKSNPNRTRLSTKQPVTARVTYGTGLRQSKKGGRVTVKGMAPIMEFNDVGDDPYVMRNPVA